MDHLPTNADRDAWIRINDISTALGTRPRTVRRPPSRGQRRSCQTESADDVRRTVQELGPDVQIVALIELTRDLGGSVPWFRSICHGEALLSMKNPVGQERDYPLPSLEFEPTCKNDPLAGISAGQGVILALHQGFETPDPLVKGIYSSGCTCVHHRPVELSVRRIE